MGMMCASSGWSVEASARTAMLTPRKLRCRALARRRKLVRVKGIGGYTSITAQRGFGCTVASVMLRISKGEWRFFSVNWMQMPEILHFQKSCPVQCFDALEGRPFGIADHVALVQPVFLLFHQDVAVDDIQIVEPCFIGSI